MTTQVLLVTGSRACADTPAAEAWARGVLAEAIGALPAGSLLYTGDARGPDRWAVEIANEHGVTWLAFGLDGVVRSSERSYFWDAFARQNRAYHGPKRWPLVRNIALVHAVLSARREFGFVARALALHAPWAATRGTGHTVGVCKAQGLTDVTEHLCPADAAPGGKR